MTKPVRLGARRRVHRELPRTTDELRQAAVDFAVMTKCLATIAARRPLTGLEQQIVSRAGRLAHDFLTDAIDAGSGRK